MNKKIIFQCLLAAGIMSGISFAQADEGRGFYAGAFGGAGRSTGSTITQTTTVDAEEFLLPVNVSGDTKKDTFGILGVTAGHEWGSSNSLKPAVELEGFYFWGDQKANLSNKNRENAIPGPEYVEVGDHTFTNSFDMKSFAVMLNGVVSLDTGTLFTPYAGAGIGFARVSLDNGNSAQTCKKLNGVGSCGLRTSSPSGDVVNHFNTDNNASDTVFAAQAKLGLRAELSKNLSMFAEYRYLRLNNASYTFGNTSYPDHFQTDKWKVESDSTSLNFGIVGVQYAF